MASNSTIILPNPYTPLAFLPPTLAGQFQASGYLCVACISAYVWDWFMSIPNEYRILRKSKLCGPNVAYVLSRVGTLGFCVMCTVYEVAPVAHCQLLLNFIAVFFVIAMPATSLLFFYRVRAVWSKSKVVSYFFGFMWFVIFGLCVPIPWAVKGGHIGPTQRCINTVVRWFTSPPIVANAIYDTLIFLAISFRIVSYTIVGETWQARLKCFVSGDGLPRLSKGLLQGGQLYYFATIGLSITTTVMVVSSSVPPVFHALFSVPNIALESAMACRVFRDVKLGLLKDVYFTTNGTIIPPSRMQFENSGSFALKQSTFDNSRNIQVNVGITKTTDFGGEYPQVPYEYDKPAPLVENSEASEQV